MKKVILKDTLPYNVLFISHDDLDGSGCVLVGKRVFRNVTYIKSNLYDLDVIINNLIENNEDEKYDMIFFTDLCPSSYSIHKLSKRKSWDNIFIIDHHKTAYDRVNEDFDLSDDKYERIHIHVTDAKDGELTCGTYLTLKVLQARFNFSLTKADNYLKKYIKAIRYWDTFLWTKKNYVRAVDLNFIFKSMSYDNFIEEKSKLFRECVDNEEEPFEFFSDKENEIIDSKWEELQVALDTAFKEERFIECSDSNTFKDLFIIDDEDKFFKDNDITGVRILLVGTNDSKYISLMSHFLFKDYKKVSAIIFVDLKFLGYSYRGKDGKNIRVDKLAKFFGGGGHILSSGSPYFNNVNDKFKVVPVPKDFNGEYFIK